MRLGCSTFVFDVYQDQIWPLDERMKFIRNAGFEGVEFTPPDPDDQTEPAARAARARAAVERAHLAYASTGLFVEVPESDPSLQGRHQEQLAMVARLSGRQQVDYAHLAGVEVLVTHAWPGPHQVGREATDDDFRALASTLRDLIAYAGRVNIPLALHNHLGNLGQTEVEMDRLLRAVPGLTVCLDTAHLAAAGDNPPAFVRRHADRLGFIHLKNLDPDWQTLRVQGKMIFSQLDEGCLDIGAILAALEEVGFKGWVMVELERPAGTPEESIRRERDYLRRLGM